MLSLAAVCDLFEAHVCCWVDNTAAEHALNKGYSKDLRFSAIIGAFWVWAASRSLSVSFTEFRVRRASRTASPVSFKEVWPILQTFKAEADYKNYETEFAQLVASLSSQLH